MQMREAFNVFHIFSPNNLYIIWGNKIEGKNFWSHFYDDHSKGGEAIFNSFDAIQVMFPANARSILREFDAGQLEYGRGVHGEQKIWSQFDL